MGGVGKSKLELTYEFGPGWKGSIFTPVTSNLSALRQQTSLESEVEEEYRKVRRWRLSYCLTPR